MAVKMLSKKDLSLIDLTQPTDLGPSILGGKGYHLTQMHKLGIPVPPAYLLTTDACKAYQLNPSGTMDYIRKNVIPQIREGLTAQAGGYMPLVSIRSGAPVSMPGMMDTILNVGLDYMNLAQWDTRLGSACAADCVKRLGEMYADVVGKDLPAHADDQILGAIEAVFKSWNTDRAVMYRKLNKIPDNLGTAVIVQSMVFGNYNQDSCAGVMFTRDPSTGKNEMMMEFVVSGQGEDVVAGTHAIKLNQDDMLKWNPAIYDRLMTVNTFLEKHYNDMQDVEFTVQDGKLYILQCRKGVRTAQAAVRIATDLLIEGKIELKDLKNRMSRRDYLSLNMTYVDPKFDGAPTVVGLPASNGVAVGVAVFDSQSAVNCKVPCILVRDETTPDDLEGINASIGILTRTGGATSHAALVARGMGKVCVVGCTDLPGLAEGDTVTLDGSTGRVWVNIDVPLIKADTGDADRLLIAVAQKTNGMRIVTQAKDVVKFGSWFYTGGLTLNQLASELPLAVKNMFEGVIDLTPNEAFQKGNSLLSLAFPITPDTIYEHLLGAVNLLPFLIGNPKTIQLVIPHGMPVDLKEIATQKGYKFLPIISSIEELVDTESGLVKVASNMSLTGTLAQKILALKKKVGQSLVSADPGVAQRKENGDLDFSILTDDQRIVAVLE